MCAFFFFSSPHIYIENVKQISEVPENKDLHFYLRRKKIHHQILCPKVIKQKVPRESKDVEEVEKDAEEEEEEKKEELEKRRRRKEEEKERKDEEEEEEE